MAGARRQPSSGRPIASTDALSQRILVWLGVAVSRYPLGQISSHWIRRQAVIFFRNALLFLHPQKCDSGIRSKAEDKFKLTAQDIESSTDFLDLLVGFILPLA